MTMDQTRPVAPPSTEPVAPTDRVGAATPTTPVAPVVALAPRAKSGGVLNLLLIGAAILAVGGVTFAIGRATAPPSTQPRTGGFTGGPAVRADGSFAPGAGGPRGLVTDGGLAIDGTVTSVDADSITLTLENGEEMTFVLDGDTTFREATDATAADVAVGDKVSVKADAGGRVRGGDGGSTTADLTAGDVTVSR